jgi:hypothetical protein
MEWFPKWIQAHSAFYDRHYPEAIKMFKQLEEIPCLRNDVGLLVALGK